MTSTMGQGFGERLREERERLGLNQTKLASIMGVKILTVAQYEKGITKPNINSVYRLSDVGFNIQYVIFGRPNVPRPRQIPDIVLTSIASSIELLQTKLSIERLDDSIRYRLFLILLDDYFENPKLPTKTGKELIELVVRLI